MILQLKHIGVWSAFKVGCLIQLIITMSCFLMCVVPSLFAGLSGLVKNVTPGQALAAIAGAPLVAAVIGLVYGIGPGLVFAVWALMYNIVARLFGGLSLGFDRRVLTAIDISAAEKPKNDIDELERQIRARRAKIAP